nr:DUF547 domain-containing protein [Geoalkalibacter halelectricus]
MQHRSLKICRVLTLCGRAPLTLETRQAISPMPCSTLSHFWLRRCPKLAFWINLYNTLVIHGIIELDIKDSVKETRGFFSRIGYIIGGEVYTPNAIEHGILRANHRRVVSQIMRLLSATRILLAYNRRWSIKVQPAQKPLAPKAYSLIELLAQMNRPIRVSTSLWCAPVHPARPSIFIPRKIWKSSLKSRQKASSTGRR